MATDQRTQQQQRDHELQRHIEQERQRNWAQLQRDSGRVGQDTQRNTSTETQQPKRG